MEGISGVATNMQLKKDSEYLRFRRLMTQDVNAAIDGAYAGGATDVVVADGHGNMSNILVEELDERASLISGNNRVMCQLEGLDETFAGIFFVGHHGREGGSSRTVINHSLAGIAVNEIRVNGDVVGETELNIRVAGAFGVPPLLVTGDDAYVAEIQAAYPDLEGAAVKRGIERFSAELLPPAKARALIRDRAEAAMRKVGSARAHQLDGQIVFEVAFHKTSQAYMTTTIPGVELVSPKAIRFVAPDMVAGYKWFWGLVIIAMSATNGVLGQANA